MVRGSCNFVGGQEGEREVKDPTTKESRVTSFWNPSLASCRKFLDFEFVRVSLK
jgi:hypothetical protein